MNPGATLLARLSDANHQRGKVEVCSVTKRDLQPVESHSGSATWNCDINARDPNADALFPVLAS
jgi:hypothetical protein